MADQVKMGKVNDPEWRKAAEAAGILVRASKSFKAVTVAEAKKVGAPGLEGLPDRLVVYIEDGPPSPPQK